MPTDADYEALLPTSVVAQVVEALGEESVVMRLGNVIPIPTGQATVPVLSTMPQASFVTPRFGGRKPATEIEWSAARLVAEEIACTLAIPDSFIDDSAIPVWDSVRPALATAISSTLDAAVLFGVDAPASYPVGGIAALAAPPVGTAGEAVASLNEAMGAVEASGLEVDGIASSTLIKQALREQAITNLQPPQTAISYSFFGVPIAVTPVWDSAQGDAFVGAWGTSLLVGLREDITYELSTDGVLLDDANVIIVSAFQDDSTLMRVRMRVGVAVGRPVKADGSGPVDPFKAAKWTAAAPGTRKAA